MEMEMEMNVKVSIDKVAVDQNYYWQPMDSCPRGIKIQLLGIGGLPAYGLWDGKNRFWSAWAPLPKKPEWMNK